MTATQREITATRWPFDTVLIANQGDEIALRIPRGRA